MAGGTPPASRTTATDAQDGEERRGVDSTRRVEEAVRRPQPRETSPFELRTARVTRARQLPTVLPYDYLSRRFMNSDPGVRSPWRATSRAPAVRLHEGGYTLRPACGSSDRHPGVSSSIRHTNDGDRAGVLSQDGCSPAGADDHRRSVLDRISQDPRAAVGRRRASFGSNFTNGGGCQ